MERITSRKNELVAHIRKLSGSRSARRAAGEFVCDGPKLLAEALKWGAAVTTVVAEEGTSLPAAINWPSFATRLRNRGEIQRSLLLSVLANSYKTSRDVRLIA